MGYTHLHTILTHLTQFPPFPAKTSSRGRQIFSAFRFIYSTRNFIIFPWGRHMPTLTALWKRNGNALWRQETCRTPAVKPEPRDCRGRMQAHRAGMRGWQWSGRERMEVGWQYYQPTCVTVTKLRNPFVYKAFRAISCHSRQCDFSRRRDRQETQSGTGQLFASCAFRG